MNKNTVYMLSTLQRAGISLNDALALRRISMTLHAWHEMECGNDHGMIGRDEFTSKAYWVGAHSGHRIRIADLETGALKRLAKVMSNYPTLRAYVQGDPRGAALYILRPGDVPDGMPADAFYSNGLAVYK